MNQAIVKWCPPVPGPEDYIRAVELLMPDQYPRGFATYLGIRYWLADSLRRLFP